MSTITDVARRAGVSVATVSRALRGLDRVSPQTRDRVIQVAEELHYVASPTATSLASGRTRVVAVVTPFLTRWFFAALVSAIEEGLRERQHHVLLFDLEGDDYVTRLELSREMLWKRADGVIVLNVPLREAEIELLDGIGLPTVAIGSPLPGRPLVAIDDARAVRTATEHLLGLGHREIAYIGTVPRGAAHQATPRARLSGFRSTMEEHGLAVRHAWLMPSDWTAQSARARFATLLGDGGERPTAVVAASDEMAFGVIRAATDAGLSVPGDLSVVGIDDHHLSDIFELTTVRQDVDAQGRLAAEILLGALTGDTPLSAEARILPIELVVRSTTGPVASPAP